MIWRSSKELGMERRNGGWAKDYWKYIRVLTNGSSYGTMDMEFSTYLGMLMIFSFFKLIMHFLSFLSRVTHSTSGVHFRSLKEYLDVSKALSIVQSGPKNLNKLRFLDLQMGRIRSYDDMTNSLGCLFSLGSGIPPLTSKSKKLLITLFLLLVNQAIS